MTTTITSPLDKLTERTLLGLRSKEGVHAAEIKVDENMKRRIEVAYEGELFVIFLCQY